MHIDASSAVQTGTIASPAVDIPRVVEAICPGDLPPAVSDASNVMALANAPHVSQPDIGVGWKVLAVCCFFGGGAIATGAVCLILSILTQGS